MKTYYQTCVHFVEGRKMKIMLQSFGNNYVKMEGKLKHAEMGKYI